ncbi:MAG: hypothetical protein IT221_03805 [Fluviicola sp.]|nr:hypothetical protein [Fluviicola sp.]
MRIILLLSIMLLFTSVEVNAQNSNESLQYFSVFTVKSDNQVHLKNLERTLLNNRNFEMVRVDYSRNSVFIVSSPGFVLNETTLQTLCGDDYQYVRCPQYGVQWWNQPDFDALYNCNSN